MLPIMFRRGRFAFMLPLLLAGCASGGTESPAPQPVSAAPRYSPHGLETVIGRTALFLEAQFGRAQLDVREEPARKLQFAGPACVLDAYL